MKARLEIPSRAFILTIAFYETHVFPRFVPEIFARFTYFVIPYKSLRFACFRVLHLAFSRFQAATFGCNPTERSTAFSCPHTFSQFASRR